VRDLACARPVIHEGVDHKPLVLGDSWREASGTGPIERCERRNRKPRSHSAIVSPLIVDREIRMVACEGIEVAGMAVDGWMSRVTVVADKES
jgi:hypothetical protein